MSSATSTNATDLHGRTRTDEGFRVSHFFVLLSLVAATVAVILARPAAPEDLVLISLTIGAAGLAAIAFYKTIAPLVSAASDYEREPMSESLRKDLEREKALTLRSIKELEFDKAMGKLSQQDFDQMADRLRARAVGIMRQLEAGAAIYRTEIEKELAARIGNAPHRKAQDIKVPDPQVRPTAEPASTSERRPGRQVGACACGTANDTDAKFCKSCGARLQGSAA
jgi:hypothetical protein